MLLYLSAAPPYQQYMFQNSVYGVPVVHEHQTERTAGLFGCVVSIGTHLIHCFCPCFQFRSKPVIQVHSPKGGLFKSRCSYGDLYKAHCIHTEDYGPEQHALHHCNTKVQDWAWKFPGALQILETV
ncbi:hypothetical protein NE237_026113 [Protea cynaroides]|uniref:Uncharacterized protein n=1 Tax=Protea cynaroides TaxID=273540 RepID=A0A9Q0H349_9MAGN|nr:hypothetical protein NE237_026113 [Protea cynaroides]